MTSSRDRNDRASFQQVVAYVEGDLEEYHGQEYVIRGLNFEKGFGIGLSHVGDGVPPDDIVPFDVYQTVTETVRSQIDVEAVKRRTTPEMWPHIGICRLSIQDDESVKVEIEISDLGSIGK